MHRSDGRIPYSGVIDDRHEDLTGEIAAPSPRGGSPGPLRFFLAFAPWLAVLVALCAWLLVRDLHLYWPPLGFAVALVGTLRVLGRFRRELREKSRAPGRAPLLLCGTGFWRDMALVWTDGPALHVLGTRTTFRVERREIARMDYRPFAREMDLWFARDGRDVRLRIGALVSLVDLPRLAREVRAWLDAGRVRA